MPHGQGESVKGKNAAREKPMLTDLSTQARTRRVARWRRRPFCRTAHAPASAHSAPIRSTAQERKIHGVLPLALHKIQRTNPGLACSPDLAKSGCWAPQADRRDGKTCRAVPGAKTVRGSLVGFRMNLGTTCTLGPSPRRNSRQVTPHQADRRLDTSSLSSSRRQTDLMQFLLPFSRSRSQIDTAVPYTADCDSTLRQLLPCLPGARSLDTPPGTRDYSIARDCSCPPPIGCRHVSPTDTLRALGGASSERGRKRKQGASRYTTTVRTPDSLLHLPIHM